MTPDLGHLRRALASAAAASAAPVPSGAGAAPPGEAEPMRPQAGSAPPGEAAASAAAVAALFFPGARGPELLFIRRAEREGDPWSGHMAFPGGRRDPVDDDLVATARRETREELGVDLAAGELLGALPVIPAVARGRRVGMTVAPYAFLLPARPLLAPNHEVVEVHTAPLAALIAGAGQVTVPYQFEGQRLELPGVAVGGHVVWGLTYRILEDLFAALRRTG